LAKDNGCYLLTSAIAALLDRAWKASATANAALKVECVRPMTSARHLSFRETALVLASEVCSLLDPKSNRIAAITGRELGGAAAKVSNDLKRMLSAGADDAKMRNRLFESYRILWQFFHLVVSLVNHSLAENETFRLALEQSENCLIAPKPFKPFREYVFFYRFQAFASRESSLNAPTRPFARSLLGGSIDHYVRHWQLWGLVEMLFTIIRRQRPNETIRWLDLGCGRGSAVNAVRLEECLPDEDWQIVGIDWNESAIKIANKSAGLRRSFLVGDVKEAVDKVGGEKFNIISAFEFVEHLEDPVKTLTDYLPLCSDFFIAGSPLLERQGWIPSPEHVWTFDRKGYQEILRAAGLTPAFSNEAYVGSYHSKGHNWVTVIAGVGKGLPARIAPDSGITEWSREQ
jgi:hypothetical protein